MSLSRQKLEQGFFRGTSFLVGKGILVYSVIGPVKAEIVIHAKLLSQSFRQKYMGFFVTEPE